MPSLGRVFILPIAVIGCMSESRKHCAALQHGEPGELGHPSSGVSHHHGLMTPGRSEGIDCVLNEIYVGEAIIPFDLAAENWNSLCNLDTTLPIY